MLKELRYAALDDALSRADELAHAGPNRSYWAEFGSRERAALASESMVLPPELRFSIVVYRARRAESLGRFQDDDA